MESGKGMPAIKNRLVVFKLPSCLLELYAKLVVDDMVLPFFLNLCLNNKLLLKLVASDILDDLEVPSFILKPLSFVET